MTVRIERDGKVLRVTLDRPEALNAIDHSVLEGLETMVESAARMDAQVVVLRGAGRSFCAGADLHEVRRMRAEPRELRDFMRRLGTVLTRLEQGPWVSVAGVHGHAVAGGLEIALACDIVVTASDAQIGDRHVEYGLVPAAGGSVRLPAAVPRAVARYLLLTGELLTGEAAAACGLVALSVAPEELDAAVDRVVERLRSRGHNTLRAARSMAADPASREIAFDRELDLFMAHVTDSGDVADGLDAFASRR